MNVSVTVIDTTAKGVQVALGSTDAPPFWLPRAHPAVIWSTEPEPGQPVTVRLPSWIVSKHGQLQALRHQRSLAFHQPPAGLDPVKASAEGSFPVAYDNNMTGVLFKNDKRETEKQPLYKGSCEINGQKFWISAWLKDGRNGKCMSLAFKPADEQRQQPAPANAYAAATGREDRQHGGGGYVERDEIPFAPEVR
jgi:hypothetical protein